MADATTAERPAGMLTVKDYKSDQKPVWCPGCGDFGVLSATFKALAALQLPKHQVVVVSGIGCSSRSPYFMSTFGLHGVHGRALPIATGLKLARPDLTVLVMGGDGDLMAIGAGHLPHAAARNIDITCVMMDNQTYGLTKAQASPTSFIGQKTKSTPYGVIAKPLNPVLFALVYGATFVARGYSARPNELANILVEAIKHKGFSFVHVQSPCAEFYNTYDYYDQRVTELPPDWDRHDLKAAVELALTEDRVHLGVFYEGERPVYELQARQAAPGVEEFDLATYLKENFS
ncbi:2-oxoglutarate oxidoreductase subunit KorB [bacterium HR25]|jgi:2-oxoglutarate ferredoxin oxidoreductase subunit beta|nr:2-oxoglutarate oxidoreductase subunit KorB [bacterium HR25]